jgi:hypothetical protein
MQHRRAADDIAGEPPLKRRFEPVAGERFLAYRRAMRRFLAAVFGLFLVLGLFACESHSGCAPGNLCECSGGDSCVLPCDGDNCDESCHDMVHCQTTCGNGCTSTCLHQGDGCDQSCGAGCGLECGNTPNCESTCGNDCQYDCHDTSNCTAHVGPDSVVTCTSVGACTVVCAGSCVVHCTQNCNITCQDGSAPTMCDSGRYACGSC